MREGAAERFGEDRGYAEADGRPNGFAASRPVIRYGQDGLAVLRYKRDTRRAADAVRKAVAIHVDDQLDDDLPEHDGALAGQFDRRDVDRDPVPSQRIIELADAAGELRQERID